MTKSEREEHEYKSLFTDERYAKKAWRQFIGKALESDGSALPVSVDPKTGEKTFQSQLDQMAYDNVKKRLQKEGLSREPMQAELIVENNILRARFTDTTFNTLLDRTMGKVKEELNISKSQFEDMTDDELEALQRYRDSKNQKESE